MRVKAPGPIMALLHGLVCKAVRYDMNRSPALGSGAALSKYLPLVKLLSGFSSAREARTASADCGEDRMNIPVPSTQQKPGNGS